MHYFIITGDYYYYSPYTKIATTTSVVWSSRGNWIENQSKAKQYRSRKIAEAAVQQLNKKNTEFLKAKGVSVKEIPMSPYKDNAIGENFNC